MLLLTLMLRDAATPRYADYFSRAPLAEFRRCCFFFAAAAITRCHERR